MSYYYIRRLYHKKDERKRGREGEREKKEARGKERGERDPKMREGGIQAGKEGHNVNCEQEHKPQELSLITDRKATKMRDTLEDHLTIPYPFKTDHSYFAVPQLYL
jgi:hypothetical protein